MNHCHIILDLLPLYIEDMVSPETAVAAALTGYITDPTTINEPLEIQMPEKFLINDSAVLAPIPEAEAADAAADVSDDMGDDFAIDDVFDFEDVPGFEDISLDDLDDGE